MAVHCIMSTYLCMHQIIYQWMAAQCIVSSRFSLCMHLAIYEGMATHYIMFMAYLCMHLAIYEGRAVHCVVSIYF